MTEEGTMLHFSIPVNELDNNSVIESATLRLLLDHDEDDEPNTELEIRVYQSRLPDEQRRRNRLLHRLRVPQPQNIRRRWLEFELGGQIIGNVNANELKLLVQVLLKVIHAKINLSFK